MKQYISIRSFARFVATFKGVFIFCCLMFVIADTMLAVIPWFIGQLVASLSRTGHADMWAWTAVLVLASVVHDSSWRAAEIIYLKLLYPHLQRFDDLVFKVIVQRDYGYFVNRFSGKVSSYTNSLGREFRELAENFCYQYVNLAVQIPIVSAIMFSINFYTGLIFVGSLLLMFISGRRLASLAAKAERKLADERSNMDGYIVDTIANFVSVKSFHNERFEAARSHDLRTRVLELAQRSYRQDIIFWGAMSFFVRWVIWPGTILLNVYYYSHGELSLAQLSTFLSAILIFSNFIWEVIWSVSQLTIKLARTEEAYRYLFDERDITEELRREITPLPPVAMFQESLELKHLHFAYPDKADTNVLDDISLHVRRGEKIGIVGPSGGGKSTLTKLLLGYYPVDPDSILLDGQPTDNKLLPQLIAYVPQDTSAFHRSIRDNIAYAKPDASEAEITAAAKHAQAHEFIMDSEHGYDTEVGERGIKLSGGQRQRIAIARALLKDAPLLILDEATSALDSESEILIQKALWDLMEGRTALVIAHRLSTIQKMDRIIVVDKGRIVEAGSHQQLLDEKGLYAKLWAHQSGGFLEE